MRAAGRRRESMNAGALELVLPGEDAGPGKLLVRRVIIAVALLLLSTVIVFVQRRGYHDVTEHTPGFVDALYFSTVSLSTTGYGDIVPVSMSARVVNIVVITPLRLIFLLVLVGTTIEVLTATVSQRARARRWRNTVNGHVVIVGYGTKGRAAATTLAEAGTPLERLAVIDLDPVAVEHAAADGVRAIRGDATRSEVLIRVAAERASRIVIASSRDDTNVLVVLTVRQLNKTATVVASVREAENATLLRSAGADAVVVSAEAAGRLLGLSADSSATADVMTDLLEAGEGLEIVERPADGPDTGRALAAEPDTLLGIVRDGRLVVDDGSGPVRVEPGDRLVVVRHAAGR